MASVTEGFLLGTHEGLTFYLLRGRLCVRRKSSLSRHRVLYSPGFEGTRQSAGEMGRASKIASRVYRELSGEQKLMVYVLFKKMTGVAKIALKWGKSEGEAEGAVRQYLVEMGVVKEEIIVMEHVKERREVKLVPGKRKIAPVKAVPRLFTVGHYVYNEMKVRYTSVSRY